MPSDPTPEIKARRLERSTRLRNECIEMLAAGERTQAEIGRHFGVAQSVVSKFKTKHLDIIQQLQRGEIERMQLLWVSDKARRVASYQTEIEHLDELIEDMRDERIVDEYGTPVDSDSLVKLYKRRDSALRAVAEELGELPARIIISSNKGAKLEIEGVGADGTPIADHV